MNPFNIIQKGNPILRVAVILFSLILLVLNLISAFARIQAGTYDALFYCYLLIAVIAILGLVKSALFSGDKTILSVDTISITSKLRKSHFVFEWTQVSRIQLDDASIIFHLNAEKKQKEIMLINLNYVDGSHLIKVIKNIAESKNIVFQDITKCQIEENQ